MIYSYSLPMLKIELNIIQYTINIFIIIRVLKGIFFMIKIMIIINIFITLKRIMKMKFILI